MSAPAAGAPRPSLFTALAVAVMCLIWGSTWLVVREGLADLAPLQAAGLRFLLAGCVMLLIAPFIARAEGGTPPPMHLVAVMAIGNFALSYGIVYWTEVVLPSSLTAILWAVFPLVTAAVGHVYLPDSRIVGRQWAGLVLGFLGVVLLFATDLEAVGPEARTRGAVLLLSPVVSALATAYVKRHGAEVSSALLNRSAMLGGGLLLVLASLLFEGPLRLPASPRGWFSVLYLALLGTVVTFSLYFWVLRRSSPTSLSLIAYVTPALALLLGVSLGGESFGPYTVAGLALVLFGSFFVLRPARGAAAGGSRPGAGTLSRR